MVRVAYFIIIGFATLLQGIYSIDIFGNRNTFNFRRDQQSSAQKDDEYYKILGVERTAHLDDIKQAYRKKAVKLHPDKGGSVEEFKKLGEAYEVLSDPSKRKLYDRLGKSGIEGNRHGFQDEETDFGNDFFGGIGGFGGGFGGFGSMFSMPIIYTVELDIEDMFRGRNLKITINSGEFTVRIEPGMYEGMEIRTQVAANGYLRDLAFVLKERPHKVFKRKNADLLIDINISLREALFGFERNITHLDGTFVVVRSRPGEVYSSGEVLAIDNLGMPVYRQPPSMNKQQNAVLRGRLFLRMKVDLPKKMTLSDEERESLDAILSHLDPLPAPPSRWHHHRQQQSIRTSKQTSFPTSSGIKITSLDDSNDESVFHPVLSDIKLFGGVGSDQEFDFD